MIGVRGRRMRRSARTDVTTVGILGCGRAGSALARAIGAGSGPVRLAGILSRRPRRAASVLRGVKGAEAFADPPRMAAASDVILLCVPDDHVAGSAARLAAAAPLRGRVILHVSGSLGSGVLASARLAGASTGSLHPLTPLATGARGAAALRGAWFAIDGGRRALSAGRRIAGHLGGEVLTVTGPARSAWHLAATIISNHSTILASLALELLEQESGLRGPRVRAAFASLLRSTAREIRDLGPLRALTGPASRADLVTLRRHLALLDRSHSALAPIYRSISALGVEMALRRGDIEEGKAKPARRLLRGPRRGR